MNFPLARFAMILVTAAVFYLPQGEPPHFCDTPQARINDPATVEWTNKLVNALTEDTACHVDRSDDDQGTFMASTPCNIFAGRVLERLYGIKDFYVTPPDPNKPFYRANEIATLLQAGVWKNWTDLGTADSQDVLTQAKKNADSGGLVIALWRNPDPSQAGHIALVGPGPLTPSGNWHLSTPASSSFKLGSASSGYLGKPLACAFKANIKDSVHIWARSTE